MAIVSAVNAMAQDLGLRVIAEGIETHEREVFLKGIGCKLGQGYLYSRPEPLELLIEKMRSGTFNFKHDLEIVMPSINKRAL